MKPWKRMPSKLWRMRWKTYFRSSSDWESHGTGDRLLIQTGTTDNLVSIPLTQAEADMTSDWWDKHRHHLNYFKGTDPSKQRARPAQMDLVEMSFVIIFPRYDHFCFLGMGDHYLQFDYTPDQVFSHVQWQKQTLFVRYIFGQIYWSINKVLFKACDSVLPFQILYDQGVITGFVWQVISEL